MSVSRIERTRILVSALNRCDTARIKAIADETGFSERTLWRYRAGDSIPSAPRLDRLERVLGISRPLAVDLEPEV